MHKIIIDTDPGIDDAQAIAFAVAHPQIELLGLCSVFGNATIDTTTTNAQIILNSFGASDVPVAKGAAEPMQQERYPAPDFVHGIDGLGNLNLPQPSQAITELDAADFIINAANQAPGKITLVAIGPLTNIAEAVRRDAELPQKIKQLVVMGGTVDEPGNVTPLAEANFINDPHAADQVLSYDWPVTLIGLDVTLKTLLRDSDLAFIRDHAGATGQFLWDSSRFYIDFYSQEFERKQRRNQQQSSEESPEEGLEAEPSCAMHDASAVVFLVQQSAFELVSGAARVVTDGVACGQLAIDRRGEPYLLPHWENRPNVHAAMQVDSELVRQCFKQTITQHSKI